MKLHAFGDSFVMGDQDDFLDEGKGITKPDHTMDRFERTEYLRYNVSFVSVIAKHFNYELANYAVGGSGNMSQLDIFVSKVLDGTIKSDDIVLFGLTTSARDRAATVDAIKKHMGQFLNHADYSLINDFNQLVKTDYLYINILLSQIAKLNNIRLIKFNLFDNNISFFNNSMEVFKDVLGCNFTHNRLIDILNDTWGNNNELEFYSGKYPKEFENLYTKTKSLYPAHPNLEGHKKIARWFIENVNLSKP